MATEAELEAAVARVLQDLGLRGVDISALSNAIRAGDVEAAVRLLGVTRARLGEIMDMVQEVFLESARAAILQTNTPLAAQIYFGLTSNSAQEWLRAKSAQLVQGIIAEQVEVVRTVLSNAFVEGNGPSRSIPLLVGALQPGGKRAGSVMGLSVNMVEWVLAARRELENLTDESFQNYQKRERRDRTHDRSIAKALREGVPLSREQIDKFVGRYTDRLLRMRASSIARTEFRAAQEGGKFSGMLEMIESGEIREQDITKVWDASGDARTRPSHLFMEGRKAAFREPFTIGSRGQISQMMYPSDTSLRARAQEIVNCRCVARYEVDYYAGLE